MADRRGPIEIRSDEIIRRPADLPVVTDEQLGPWQPGGFNLNQIKQWLTDFKDIIQAVKDAGLGDQLDSLGIKLPGGQIGAERQISGPQPQISKPQILAFLNLIQKFYGDDKMSIVISKLEKELPDQVQGMMGR